jgi:hypothetical protein
VIGAQTVSTVRNPGTSAFDDLPRGDVQKFDVRCVADAPLLRYRDRYQVPATWYGDTYWDPPPSVAPPTPPRGASASFSIGGARGGARRPALWEARTVSDRRAVLSSASTSLEELVVRVTDVADEVQAEGDEGLAHDLYEVERALRTAHRRLSAVARRLR